MKKVTLDEFLSTQDDEGFLCTIDQVPNDNTRVKLTPWLDDHDGCRYDAALLVEKSMIEHVTVTEQTHLCCGRRHPIVEVFFKANASLKLTDVLKKMIDVARANVTAKRHDRMIPAGIDYRPAVHYTAAQPDANSSARLPIGAKVSPKKDIICPRPLIGCGLCQAPNYVCQSGCACQSNDGTWYCCQSGCCE